MLNKESLIEQMKSSKDFRNMTEQLKMEVHEFFSNFEDSSTKVSAWGHHYFCKDDGNVLLYNPQDSTHHICPICKKDYSSPLLSGVWVYLYRNEAALTILKSAILYNISNEKKYLDIAIKLTSFYILSYEEFNLHNKEGNEYESISSMKWGCGRIMPQNLNEAIFFIRIFTGLEMIKNELPEELLTVIKKDFSNQIFDLLKPQIDKIHNISCWMNSALGVIGLFADNKEILDFVFHGEFNINRQLREGVTEDGFWYEGSIHYNFFTLEGIMYLALFTNEYKAEFEELKIGEKMLISGYNYAFSNQQLPNPNDGWPNINLKTYSYIYSVGTKVFGYESQVGHILAQILSSEYERGEVPLSKPYYYNNHLSLEQYVFLPDFNSKVKVIPNTKSMDYEKSNYSILKNDIFNLFYKYGHHGPSHAHPDKMTIEAVCGENVLTKDLSNSGYGSIICNEWHRVTASHNTVVVDGENHTSFLPGKKLNFEPNSCNASADEVYEDVTFRRKIELFHDGFQDEFEVTSSKHRNYDFVFHVEAELEQKKGNFSIVNHEVDLSYKENGYAYFYDVKELKAVDSLNDLTLYWKLGDYQLVSRIDISDTLVYIAKSPANPVTSYRTSIILRRKTKQTTFHMKWKLV
jgi:hypothetical protein